MSIRQKGLVLVWGLLWLALGVLSAIGFPILAVLGSYDWYLGIGVMAPLLAGLVGGGLVAFFAMRSITRRRTWPWRLPPTWALGGGFVVSLAAGLGLWQVRMSRGFLVPIFVAAVAALAPLTVVGWVVGRRPGGVNARRGWASLGLGATASTSLALMLNTLLPTAVLYLIFGLIDALSPLAKDLSEFMQLGSLAQELLSPWFLVVLVEIAVIAPLVEELVKPLALLPLLKRLDSDRDAFLLGALVGAGFAAVENVLYATMFSFSWGGVLAARAMGAALHPFGAGLMAVAWRGVLRREPGAVGRWARNYGLAVGAHALWNGTCVVAAAVGYVWFQGWKVDLLGVSDAAVLFALLALEGIALLAALRAVSRRMEPVTEEGEAVAPTPALPTERALAVWGLVCLVVLVPVGLGVLRTVW